MARLITISNRLPVSVKRIDEKLVYESSVGGLATGLSSTQSVRENFWVGWPGGTFDSPYDQMELRQKMSEKNMHPVFLSENDYEKFYEGFSNKTVWPLFHYFTQYTRYNKGYWDAYKRVNQQFCDEIVRIANADDIFWVHDYQLMLLPGMLRKKFPNATIGFFLHIPFPSYEIFRGLPWRQEILEGILGADLIGFHTYDYVRHFLSAATRILSLDHYLGRINLDNRVAEVDSFPMGIDFDKFAKAVYEKETIREIIELRQQFGDYKIMLSVDRLDYSKGILQRILSFERLLEEYPEYRGKVTLLMVIVPSRSGVDQYASLKEQIDEAVGRISSKFSTIRWTAIHYFYRSLPFHTLAALYYMSDIALVTPFRDGMNLIAKEYIASKIDQTGVLILSEMAGAAKELTEAILVNPNDINDIVKAMNQAITMPAEEQNTRNAAMQQTIKRYNVHRWTEVFLTHLKDSRTATEKIQRKQFDEQILQEITESYNQSEKRLLLLDYDGTLVGFQDEPQKASPDEKLLELLKNLTENPDNQLFVVSGRDKDTLQNWLGHLNLGIVAEHGVWTKYPLQEWSQAGILDQDWKPEIRQIMEYFVDRTPGSFIEVKDFSLVWHYRKVDTGLAEMRVHELIDTLAQYITAHRLQIMEGNKVIEIKNSGVNKGHAAGKLAERMPAGSFVLCAGDDYTDEDMFKSLANNANAYTLKVGKGATAAKYNVKSNQEVLDLLHVLSEQGKAEVVSEIVAKEDMS
ncbi:MAG: bifunctional alpha,alpha-trehalose-phosphate synthase (UDP-forming)/trehalose-phosphatase [Verrucomicrobia bacterium]|nr:bifunctional alpha,alpha-trehalose-phosphate synthase (UDP-forming)/trehalose-phosphatase [Cytophagales bacterium]